YLIFDYVSPTDFKFAGLYGQNGRAVIGQRTDNGWVISSFTNIPGNIAINQLYAMTLTVTGSTARLDVAGRTVTHTFAPRVVDGVSHGLNYGSVGIGTPDIRGIRGDATVHVV